MIRVTQQQAPPDGFDILAIVGAVTGGLSLGIQAWEAVRDRPKLVLDVFEDVDVRYELTNNGRQPVSIRSFGMTFVPPGMTRPRWYQLTERWRFWRRASHAYEPFPLQETSVAVPVGESLVVLTTRDALRRKVLQLAEMGIKITGFVAIRSDGRHIRFKHRWRNHYLFTERRSDNDPRGGYYPVLDLDKEPPEVLPEESTPGPLSLR